MRNFKAFNPLPQFKEFTLLEELEKNSFVSQRKLAIKSGMALGTTNTCLRRMAERGWIQVRNENRHRREYCLTKRGMVEKERLSSERMRCAVEHYTWIKDRIREKLLEMQNAGVRRIVLYGASEEVEIAFMTLQELNLKLVGILEDDEVSCRKERLGFRLIPVEEIASLNPEGILVISLYGTENKITKLENNIDPFRIKTFFV